MTTKKKWHVMPAVVATTIMSFCGVLIETSMNVTFPTLMKQFGIDAGLIQWVTTANLLTVAISIPLSAYLIRNVSEKNLFVSSNLFFLLGVILDSIAGNFELLLAGRILQGIGTGLILPLMFTVAMLIFPPKKLGLAMGINALVIMFAPAIGPTVTGIVLGALSWRAVFFMFAIILLVGLLFAFIGLKNVSRITRPKIDLPSVLGSVIGFSSIVAGTSLASEAGWTSPRVLGLLAVGIIVLVLYTGRQLRLDEPVLNLRVFAKPAFRTGAILVMLDFGIILSAMYLMPQFIQNAMMLPVAMTGLIMLPGGIVNALVSAFAGRMYDRMGAKLLARLGFVIALIGVLMFCFADAKSSLAYVIAAHVVLMIGCPLAMSPSQTHALNALAGPESADGSTIMNTLQQIVGAIATALATSFLAMGQASFPASSEALRFEHGVRYGFCFTAVLVIAGLIVSLTLKERTKSSDVEM